jgi:hypothetical protein
MLESFYRAGFNIADEQLDDDARRKIMRRAHEGGGSAPEWVVTRTVPAQVKPTLPGRFRLPRILAF